MPRVPLSQGPEQRSAALQGGYQQQIDVTAPARQLAKGLGDAAEVVSREAERDAQTRSNAADVEIAGQWLAKDAELRRAYQGANVDQYQTEAAAWWKERAEGLGKDLDPLSKRLIGQTLGRRQAAALGQVAQHVEVEKERHADNTAQANIQTSIQFGVTSGDVAGASVRVRQLAAEVGARKGWSTEQVLAEQSKHLSALHLAQISKLAESDAAAAQAYYQANKAEVGFTNQPRVEQILKAETDNQFATQKAASLAALPLADQIKAAADIKDPQQREKTVAQIKLNHGLVIAAQQAQEKKLSDQAWQLVGQGRRVPEAVLAGMDGRERVQLQDYLRQRAEHLAAAGSKPVKTNPVALAKVYDLMRDNPSEFKALRMESLAFTLAGSDLEQVARIQRDMAKPDREKDVATTTQLLGTYTGGWTPQKRATFQQAAFDELDRFEKEKGRPANYEEKKRVFDRLVIDGEVLSGAWYKNDPNKKFYEATPEERKRFAPTISSDDRKLVVEALKAEGITSPTDEQITARFKLAKGIR